MSDSGNDEHGSGCHKKLQDLLAILAAHSRILEKHANSIDNIGSILKKIEADIASINDSQRVQSQLTVGIHQLWSRLRCVAPSGGAETEIDDVCVVKRSGRRVESGEARQLSMILAKPDDDDTDND